MIGQLAFDEERLISSSAALRPAALALLLVAGLLLVLLQLALQLVGLLGCTLLETQIENETDEQHKDECAHGTAGDAGLLEHGTRPLGQIGAIDFLVLAALAHKSDGTLTAVDRQLGDLHSEAVGIVQTVPGIKVLRALVCGECYVRPGRRRCCCGCAHCCARR